ncbi:hypothetical protein GQ457_05G022060 [Hibiscus cannabinus]
MRILCWNCQGLGKAQAVRSLARDVTRFSADFIFLCETRLRTQNSTFLRTVLGFENCFFVDVGPGCTGLAIFWNNNITVDLLSYSALHIDVVITYDSSISFRFTGMHGRSESSLKKNNWALIDRLREASPLPWLLGGDFNEILTLSEKQGGNRKPHHQLTDFCECLLRNNLADCKPSRGWFTWMKSGPRIAPTREWLDRFMSCYLLPCSLVEEMFRSIRRFWWSGKGSARGWPLVAWDDICLPKTTGGIGLKDLHLFNIALLGKQIWRLLSAPGSLLYRTLRAKYFPDGDLFRASASARSSFARKGLHHAMLRLRDGFFWTLGINSQVRLFRDRWGVSPLSPLLGIPLTGRRFLSAAVNSWSLGKPVGIVPNFWPICPPGTWIAY